MSTHAQYCQSESDGQYAQTVRLRSRQLTESLMNVPDRFTQLVLPEVISKEKLS